jgi:hypothetical protein
MDEHTAGGLLREEARFNGEDMLADLSFNAYFQSFFPSFSSSWCPTRRPIGPERCGWPGTMCPAGLLDLPKAELPHVNLSLNERFAGIDRRGLAATSGIPGTDAMHRWH